LLKEGEIFCCSRKARSSVAQGRRDLLLIKGGEEGGSVLGVIGVEVLINSSKALTANSTETAAQQLTALLCY
jgi:hypothetical protein